MGNNQHLKFIIDGEDKSGKAVRSFQGNVKSATGSMGQSIATAAKWGAAIATAGAVAAGAAVKVAATFEAKMTNISTVLDTSVENMEEMRNEVMEIAKRTPVALDDLATSLYDVRSAGISAEDAMMVLEKSAQLATAGLGTTKEAVDLSTSAINAFGLEGEDATEAFDIMMLTVKSGKTNISELAQSFGMVAGVMKTAGVEFAELQAATAALTTTGLKASVAQNQLRAATLSIQAPTADMAKLYGKMGVASGKALIAEKGLVGAMAAIKTASGGNIEVMKKAFGSVEALGAALSLTGEQGEVFAMILEDMQDPAGVLSEAFEKQKNTFNASWQILKNNFSVALVKLGSVIMPGVAKAVQGATNKFGELMDQLEESGALEKFGQVVQTMGTVISNVFTNILVPSFEVAKVVFAGLIEIIGVLGGVFEGLIQSFTKSEIISSFFAILKGSLGEASVSFDDFKDGVKLAMGQIKDAIQVFAGWFNEYLTPIITSVVEAVIIVLALLVAAWQSNFLGIQTITQTVFTAIKDFISSALEFIRGVLDVFIGFFTGDWGRMMQGVQDTSDGFLGAIKALFDVTFGLILELASNFSGVLHGTFDSMGQGISSNLGEFWENVKSMASDSMDSMLELVSSGALMIANAWDNTWQGMKDGFVVIWNSIIDYLETKVNQAISILNKMIKGINKIPGVSVPMIGYVDINSNGASGTGRRAFGGRVLPDRSYLVGERGPEMFTPGTSGSITPNNALGDPNGGQSVNVEIVIQGDVYSESMLDQITNGVKDAIQGDLASARMGAI